MIKILQIFLFSLYFSSLNLKYLKLTKMDLTRFAMKLFIYTSTREVPKYSLAPYSKMGSPLYSPQYCSGHYLYRSDFILTENRNGKPCGCLWFTMKKCVPHNIHNLKVHTYTHTHTHTHTHIHSCQHVCVKITNHSVGNY